MMIWVSVSSIKPSNANVKVFLMQLVLLFQAVYDSVCLLLSAFHSFRTNTYKLSFMETPSGIKFILVTNPRTGDLRETLKYIYNLYVEYVAKNPLYTPGTLIRCELFNTALDQYVRSIA